MTPDPKAVAIAHASIYSYGTVRLALRLLENNGWTPYDAERYVRQCATGRVNPRWAATMAVQIGLLPEDAIEGYVQESAS